MGMLISSESVVGRELWAWDHPKGTFTGDGKNRVEGKGARGYEPYPAMLYLVTQKNPWAYEAITVHDEQEQRNLESRGFVAGGLAAACAAFEKAEVAVATLAAHRNYEDRNMSERARAERDAVEQESSRHLAVIPETPIRRRGRPKKASSTTETV